jgi:xylulose-5-phosphate/fructose-6-phosphate phosphoketolase
MPITKEELDWAVQHWTTANYIAAGAIYLKDNFLVERKLVPDDIKDMLLGHWGTCPGINFVYTHLNLLAAKKKQSIMPIVGPGHGFAAILANMFIDGSLHKYYPEFTNDKQGLGKVMKLFCWPGGFPSHANPGVPGVIHEGGELGYALGTAYGAAFDNPNLLVAVIVGDGEAETGPTAAAWHSNKFLNPKRDGAVLPIVHLNGYKINNPTIFGTMSDEELRSLFVGYGYEPRFVGEDHKQMADTLEWAHNKIKSIQSSARSGKTVVRPKWPVILLKTRKGWTGIKQHDGKLIEGNYRSHQVPVKDVKKNQKSLQQLEEWLHSYHPEQLFVQGKVPDTTKKYLPSERLGDNPHALGGSIRKPLILPRITKYEVDFKRKGSLSVRNTEVLGKYLNDVFKLNDKNKNFRLMCPDELASNKVDGVLDATKKCYVWPVTKNDVEDSKISPNGRVMEILSEHTLQAWLQGYLLTGRHGIFPCYEAFLPIVDSMVSQYLKFLKASRDYTWRKPISSLNYLLSSVCWRQDHNGFSHQNPGFINVVLNKAREEQLVRIYFPADANMLLAQSEHTLQSTDRVNIIVADKQMTKQWQNYEQAVKQCKTGAAVWDFASDKDPDVVIAACGAYQVQEALAAIKLLKQEVPSLKARFVNVSELNVLGSPRLYPNGLSEDRFEDIFTNNREVIFSFHGYPETIKQLLFDRPEAPLRFHIYGYSESGTTTTPFDLLIRNNVSRYDLAISAVTHAAEKNPDVAMEAERVIQKCRDKIREHKRYILKHGHDPEEINDWKW